ncbi:tripartite tricarboxylate transporter TctB family protein [Allostreptomyces psammosilenae]
MRTTDTGAGHPGASHSGPCDQGAPGRHRPPAGARAWLGEHAELLVSALLLVLGAVVLADAATTQALPAAESGPIGPRAVPTAVGLGLLLCAVLHAVDVLRGGRGEAEGGEDVDLTTRADWRAVTMLTAVFLANAALIEPAGWAISGALLFWGTAYALGSRSYLRDALISAGLSVGSFYAFYYGLGITLPPGVLEGIL